jgi:hypothetical protein
MTDQVPRSKVQDMSDSDLYHALYDFFGPTRMMSLIGWVVVACCIYEIDSHSDVLELIEKMQEKGFARGGIYRALTDVRRFRNHIDGLEEGRIPRFGHNDTLPIMKRLASINML